MDLFLKVDARPPRDPRLPRLCYVDKHDIAVMNTPAEGGVVTSSVSGLSLSVLAKHLLLFGDSLRSLLPPAGVSGSFAQSKVGELARLARGRYVSHLEGFTLSQRGLSAGVK